MRLHVEFWVEEHSEITDNRRWWYDVGSDENVFVDRRDFPEVCCRPTTSPLFSWCSAESASTRTSCSHTSHIQAPSPAVTSRTLDGLLCLMPCMSSANRWWRTRCCPISVVGVEPVERCITDIEALLKHIQHNTIINSIECCRHVQQHESSDVTSVDVCHHVVVQVNTCCLGRVLSAVYRQTDERYCNELLSA